MVNNHESCVSSSKHLVPDNLENAHLLPEDEVRLPRSRQHLFNSFSTPVTETFGFMKRDIVATVFEVPRRWFELPKIPSLSLFS